MDVNIPTYLDEPTINTFSRPSDHTRPTITGTPSTLPTAYDMHNHTDVHSSKTLRTRLCSSWKISLI